MSSRSPSFVTTGHYKYARNYTLTEHTMSPEVLIMSLRAWQSLSDADKAIFRSPGALGPAYEQPETVTDEDIETYLRPLVRSEQRTRDLQRFVVAFDNKHTRVIEPQLRELRSPTLIVWGTDDVYFPVKWAHWLADTIPGAKPPVELEGARIFFPEERADEFNLMLRGHLVG